MALNFKNTILDLPDKPGVYQFYDEKGNVLYIGKAKNIKKRVTSYFRKNILQDGKTRVMVNKIQDIRFTIVDTEWDAFLLENSLIKKYQPRYNIMLKDDKSFPYICIKNERFPRVFSTRNIIKDGSEYFGPYASVKIMNTFLELISKTYPLRNCNYILSEENISKNKFKVCLEYQIGNCLGPCENKQPLEEYDLSIHHIRKILKGNIKEVIRYFQFKMDEASKRYNFEEAHSIKDKLENLEKYYSKSVVVNPKINDVEVYSIVSNEAAAFVNFFKVVNGSIIQSHNIEIIKKLHESDSELLGMAIIDIKEKFNTHAKEILTSTKIELAIDGVSIFKPLRGDKKKLLELSLKNIRYFMQDQLNRNLKLNKSQKITELMEKIKKDLSLNNIPYHIECIDNSNIQGSNPVSALVVFKNAKPSKKDYRHFNIKSVIGPDDFASMREVVERRYARLVSENQPLPQLLIVDGGKGQLSSVMEALKMMKLENKIEVRAIAKKLEEIYRPGDPYPLHLDKRSQTLKIIQKIRDEAHRFGLKHHRQKRIKSTLTSELQKINGLGVKTTEKLLLHFGSVIKISNTSQKALEEVIGKHKAGIVYEYFANKK